MSCIVILPLVLPAITPVLLPIFAAAATAAATALGFSAAGTKVKAKTGVEVTLENGAEATAADLALGEERVFVKDDITVRIQRDGRGKVSVSVHGETQTRAEIEQVGREFTQRIAQQFAYHRLVTELKQRNLNMVEETVDEDGTVRVKVRVHQG